MLASPATIACGGLVAVSSGHTPLADHCSVAGSGLIVQLRLITACNFHCYNKRAVTQAK